MNMCCRCCDAIATLATSGGAPERTAAFEAGAVPVIIAVMGTNIWDEDLQVKACWALHALAPSYGKDMYTFHVTQMCAIMTPFPCSRGDRRCRRR
jgi:hypothetical protein